MEENKKKSKKNYKVPPKFKPILIDLIKEILINQPKDIIDFSTNYFTKKQEELKSEFERPTTYPILIIPPPTSDNKNKLSINKKKIVSQKSSCKKDWDKPINEESKINEEKKDEECSIFECINFEEKENILKKIKNSDSELKNKAGD